VQAHTGITNVIMNASY